MTKTDSPHSEGAKFREKKMATSLVKNVMEIDANVSLYTRYMNSHIRQSQATQGWQELETVI